jgi:hypothetical protein
MADGAMSGMSPKERDAYERTLLSRPPSDYEIRHNVHRERAWWLCRRCWLLIRPFESHRHLS